jgi:pimeloyl-ACP methyl ester carboxylesterase
VNGTMLVPSSDRVEVAVHDLGGDGPPLLLSHATGFHGHCYLPLARLLRHRFHCFALDYRGHGDTPRPDDWQVDWDRYGDDALAAARAVAPDGGLVAFGHSMGGAGLLMAAHRDPELFDLIVAFEPIVFPPPDPSTPPHQSVLVAGARRRRRSFDSMEQAIEHYGSKPPLMAFTPEALRCYVEHGFTPSEDGVTLKCDPEHEARTFETGGVHRTWELLPEITTKMVVVASTEEYGPAMIAAGIAEQLPDATYLEFAHFDHFGPMTHPDEIAELIVVHAGLADVGE